MKIKGLWTLLVVIILALTLLVLPSVVSCAKPTPAPAPTPTPTPTPTAPKVFELKWTDHWGPGSDPAKTVDLFGKIVEARTGGRVKITYYHAEALGKVKDFVDMTKGGVCDIAVLIAGNYPGTFNMLYGIELPCLGIPNRALVENISWELFYKGYFDKEMADFKVLAFLGSLPTNFYMRNKVLTLEDFKGLKLSAVDPNTSKLVELAGAAPVSMPAPDKYMALQRGTLDGACTGWEFAFGAKWYEVAKYVLWNPISGGSMPVLMNKNKWDSLPADIQVNMERAIAEYEYEWLRYYQDMDKQVPVMFRDKGAEVYQLSASEFARLQQLSAPIIDNWIADKKAKGQPGQEMIDLIRKIIGRYS